MDSTEALLQSLDEQWAKGKADLPALLRRVPTEDPKLACELCAADLEWRMRKISPPVKAMPRASDYADLLGEPWETVGVDSRRNLLEAEWCARCLWGDQPNVDRFATKLPDIADWSSDLSKQLDELIPLFIRLEGHSLRGAKPQFRASYRFTAGRQGSGDPSAPGWSRQLNRLIVANAYFRKLSREQLRVRRTGAKELEFTNLSRAVPLHSEALEIAPGASEIVSLPGSLTVGDVKIELFTQVQFPA